MEKTLTVRRADWGDSHHDFFLPWVLAHPGLSTDIIKLNVLNGYAQLFEIVDEVGPVGAYVARLERADDALELCVLASVGRSCGVKLTDVVLPFIEAQARAAGAARVRLDSNRAGMVRALLSHGYRPSTSIVMTKDV